VDLIALCGLSDAEIVVVGMAVYGDYFYASLDTYSNETYGTEALEIIQYNYHSGEYRLISLDYSAEQLVVTDNSIYYSVRKGFSSTYNLYRSTLDGENSVLLAQDIYYGWLLSGNNIYFEDSAGENKDNIVQITTDGSQRKTEPSCFFRQKRLIENLVFCKKLPL